MEAVLKGLYQARCWIHIPANQWDRTTLAVGTSTSGSPIRRKGRGNTSYRAYAYAWWKLMLGEDRRQSCIEDIPKQRLRLTQQNHQTLSHLNRSSYRNPSEGGQDTTPYQRYSGAPVPREKSLLNIWLATGSPGVPKKLKHYKLLILEWEWARTLGSSLYN
jgi:hypothetical protein